MVRGVSNGESEVQEGEKDEKEGGGGRGKKERGGGGCLRSG